VFTVSYCTLHHQVTAEMQDHQVWRLVLTVLLYITSPSHSRNARSPGMAASVYCVLLYITSPSHSRKQDHKVWGLVLTVSYCTLHHQVTAETQDHKIRWLVLTVSYCTLHHQDTAESQDHFLDDRVDLIFLCPRHSKNGGGALSVTPVRAFVHPSVPASVRYQNLVSAQ